MPDPDPKFGECSEQCFEAYEGPEADLILQLKHDLQNCGNDAKCRAAKIAAAKQRKLQLVNQLFDCLEECNQQ